MNLTAISARIESWAARRHSRLFLSLLAPASDDIILDVGAGFGWTANTVASTCKLLLALEPDLKRSAYMRHANPKISVVSGIGEAIPVNDSSVDKIYLCKSFHHVKDRQAVMKELRRVLKPSGALVLGELSPKGVGKLVNVLERKLRRINVTFLTPRDLSCILEREGFTIRSVEAIGSEYFLVAGKSREYEDSSTEDAGLSTRPQIVRSSGA